MGKNGAALITFEGTKIPYTVRLYSMVLRVIPYQPKSLICTTCHAIGHKQDSCPCVKNKRCENCGNPWHQDKPCESETPKCRNCKGAHLATDAICPARIKANQFLRNKVKRQTKTPLEQQPSQAESTNLKTGSQNQKIIKTPNTAISPVATPPQLTEEEFPKLPNIEQREPEASEMPPQPQPTRQELQPKLQRQQAQPVKPQNVARRQKESKANHTYQSFDTEEFKQQIIQEVLCEITKALRKTMREVIIEVLRETGTIPKLRDGNNHESDKME